MKFATNIAEIPPMSLAAITGNTRAVSTPAVNPRWLPRTKAPLTENAIFNIFPLSS